MTTVRLKKEEKVAALKRAIEQTAEEISKRQNTVKEMQDEIRLKKISIAQGLEVIAIQQVELQSLKKAYQLFMDAAEESEMPRRM